MKIIIVIMCLCIPVAFDAFSQIEMADSTVQVISYWDKGEKQLYSVATEKIKVKGIDTTSREKTTYQVEINVLDSTEKSYTVQWLYKNIESDNNDALYKKLLNVKGDMKVIFKTDENGVFKEVVNWKEIKDYIQQAIEAMKNEWSEIPEMEKLLKQLESTYSSREAIESASIKDIQQFHTFHGARYKLGELLEGTIQVPNLFGRKPFDAVFTVSLDEIMEEDNNYIIRAQQEVDQKQLTDAMFDYLTTMAKNLNTKPPVRDELKDLKNEITTSSLIHTSGWVVYSVQTTTVTSDNITHIEERTIELE